jgi:hypothetical protein
VKLLDHGIAGLTMRLNLSITELTCKRIENIISDTENDMNNKAAVVRRAVMLLDYLIDAEKKGNEIILKDKNTEKNITMLL